LLCYWCLAFSLNRDLRPEVRAGVNVSIGVNLPAYRFAAPPEVVVIPGTLFTWSLALRWMFCFFKATGGVLMKGTGTDPGTIKGRGATSNPGGFPMD